MSFWKTVRNKNFSFVVIDLLMVGLLVLNLLLISFDWFYSLTAVKAFIQVHTPAFFEAYTSHVHAHFLVIDLAFVGAFLFEFLLSWLVAIRQHTYHKWFFYPFIHWYDLVGCIPLHAFRIVRVLRVFTILYRLHRLKIIELDKTYIYKKLKKYYEILVEEVSDRVVENIIDEMQVEVHEAGPTLDHIIKDVLRPKQAVIVDWLSRQIADQAKQNFVRRQGEIREYVEQSIAHAFRKNDEIRKIEQIPVAGKAMSQTLERSIGNIVYNIIESSMMDLGSSRNRILIEEATEIVFNTIERREEDDALYALILETLIEVLEIVKNQVAHIKRWKERDLAEQLG